MKIDDNLTYVVLWSEKQQQHHIESLIFYDFNKNKVSSDYNIIFRGSFDSCCLFIKKDQEELKNKRIFLIECFAIAIVKAQKQGLKRLINPLRFVNCFMDESVCFIPNNEDKKTVVTWMVNYLLDIEEICQSIDKGKFSESLFKLNIMDSCVW